MTYDQTEETYREIMSDLSQLSEERANGKKRSQVIVKGEEALEALSEGFEEVASAVASTLGPKGRLVAIKEKGKPTRITKDGFTVARSIELNDPVLNVGAGIMKEVSDKVASLAGDGTTTATILAYTLLKSASSSRDIKTLESELKDIILPALTKQSIEATSKLLHAVALVSSNGDKELSSFLTDSVIQFGDYVTICESAISEPFSYSDTLGYKIELKPQSFVFLEGKQQNSYSNPLIFWAEEPIDSVAKLLNIFGTASNVNKPLIIIAPSYSAEVVAVAAHNVHKGKIKATLLKKPVISEVAHDLMVYTGSVLNASNVVFEGVVVFDNESTVFKPTELRDEVTTLVNQLREGLQKSDELTKNRIRKLVGAERLVSIGGETAIEMKERYDRAEDILGAVRSAAKEGVVVGAGETLDHLSSVVSTMSPWYQTLKSVRKTLALNAGMKELPKGYNLRTEQVEDLVESGVVDPVFVLRTALETAFSVVSVVLSTRTLIVEE